MRTPDIVVATSEKIDLNKYRFGQEYYLKTLVSILEEIGYRIQVLDLNELYYLINNTGNPPYIHLYYLDLASEIKIRGMCKNSELIYHIYHLEDITWNKINTLRWKAFLMTSQFYIDKYLLTSRYLIERLKPYIRFSRLSLIEPFYSCRCNSFNNIETLIEEKIEKIRSKELLRFLYLGRYDPRRLPLTELIRTLKRYSMQQGKLELKIISMSEGISDMVKTIGNNFKLEMRKKYLNEEEKCETYRKTDFFIFLPKGNTAMNPPITILEAIYHGAIPLVAPSVLKDLNILKELVVKDINEIPSIIESLSEKKVQRRVRDSLLKLNYFYDKARYINSLKNLMEK
jgi:hypothetical protein